MSVTEPAAPGAGTRRKRGAVLEDTIRSAAYAELCDVGYAAFTVEGVAARARTGKASIYRRWPTRQELVLDALCAELPTPAQCGLEVEFDDSVATAEALRRVAMVISAVLASPAGAAMRAVKLESASDPDLARVVDERFQAPRRAVLLALLRRGVDRGEVREGAATQLVADVLPAMLLHRMLLQNEPVTGQDVAEIVEQVLIPLVAAR
ncbi:TetR/AcrR family transcriptional regulator [Rhodococcus sp. D2-41]|uniref:TetR/AcrR family transcriptional regulator n=1 Tax=Speluncibacter jeojiensis TaxID=2710754 RepID=A0A9X4LZA1_9ACTN|nr:TetR/AcrR family transcriptional regulator [Rhodococcus sp. D2-41]MDG3010402.1 TetR/AcrR family transcriptional regulator [Rhodococcus sp. D2-41]MDG3014140.1 TetR/AcrR family transcriptional regulator [Corynebacteriales bacterium D3-21]